MQIFEPCCAIKNMAELMNKMNGENSVWFHGYGDMTIDELLASLMPRCWKSKMVLICPTLPDAAIKALEKHMQKQWTKADGSGKDYAIATLEVITDTRKKKSPKTLTWLKDNPLAERISLVDAQQNDTILLVDSIAFVGPINLAPSGHFTAVATKNPNIIADIREKITRMKEENKASQKEA